HTRFSRDWSSDVCSSDLRCAGACAGAARRRRCGRPGRIAAELRRPPTLHRPAGSRRRSRLRAARSGRCAMTVNYRKLREKRFDDIVQRYGIKDSILYHLGLNIGSDPVDERELRYVYERELVALPSLCTILGHPANWMRDPELG